MTHSTLTWFSNVIKPTNTGDQYIVALQSVSGKPLVYSVLLGYSEEEDCFVHLDGRRFSRNSVLYWAYVPICIDLKHGMEKQSQVPEEK